MRSNYIIILFSLPILFVCSCKRMQVDPSPEFRLNIKQLNFLSPTRYWFDIDNSQLLIKKVTPSKPKNQPIQAKTKVIYKKKLSVEQLASIRKTLITEKILELDTFYSCGMMDGFRWDFEIYMEGKLKRFSLHNFYIKEPDSLVSKINSLIPNRKPHIVSAAYINCNKN